jgi:NADH:ubiquinone oxidoreductase subunit 6 (subunit J)
MILEALSAGLLISACLAVFLDEAVYSIAALAGTFFFTALLFVESGAIFVAVFQFAVGVGTLAILFLSGEMLSEKALKRTSPKNALAIAAGGVILSLFPIFISISGPTTVGVPVSFGEALWSFRAVDIVLQGMVVMAVAIGIAIILYEKRNGER